MEKEEIELVKIYWDEYKLRHEHYWKSFFRFGFAIVFLLALPFVYPVKTGSLGNFIIAIPILAVTLSLFSAWLLRSEYDRLRKTDDNLRVLIPKEYRRAATTPKGLAKLFEVRIGVVVSVLFGVVFVAISGTQLYLLINR
jgi:uncharacterized membrane protein